ncbi:putative ATP-dependent RNA helicase DHR2 [Spathaspora sp. JA1]|nr:putative ATP-dependent RNA helicase DHR2 [Spathaspora sp. JA1]
MSNDVMSLNMADSDPAGVKKRKRKRSKKVHSDQLDLHQEVNGNDKKRVNKKLMFDQDEVEAAPREDLPGKTTEIQPEIVEKISEKTLDHKHKAEQSEQKSEHKHKHKHKIEHEHKHEKKNEHSSEHKHDHKDKHIHKPKLVKFEEEEDEDDEDDDFSNNKFTFTTSKQLTQRSNDLLEVRKQLPIYRHHDNILSYIQSNQVTIIIGETGSGKSTQIPQFLMNVSSKMIGVTQPRRVAAASLASRVSEEYGCKLGNDVGYQVRFTNMTSTRTKLKYLTDGMLLREIMLDNKLQKYSIIILDEAHERTILTDLIMGFLKSLLLSGERPDLKVVIMSATLNAELFSKFFNNSPVLFIEGKMYPVSQHYLDDEDTSDIVDTMIRTIIQVNLTEPEGGDILCFLSGQEEIDNCVKVLTDLAPQLPKQAPLIVPLPLYAALSPHQQSKIFESLPKHQRKVILATNIAETSITVSGVKYVIDSGLRKVKVWKHNLGLSTLLTTPISQASAKQRAGRAGRESPGKVFRLYSESIFSTFATQQESEIKRNDIILPVLTLKKLGIDDLLNWTWLEYPGQDSILHALNSLYTLGALNDSGKVTSLGYKMSILPLIPQLSVVLLTAVELGVVSAVIDIVSCLSVDNLILNVTGEARDEVNFKRRSYCPLGIQYGDLISMYEYFNNFQKFTSQSEAKSWCNEMMFSYKGFKNVLKVRNQLKEYMYTTIKQDDSLTNQEREQQLSNLKAQFEQEQPDDEEDIGVSEGINIPNVLKSFLKGYITNTAVGMPDRSFRTFNTGQLISIHPSSSLFGKSNIDAIMYIEYVYTMKSYARNCSIIELAWLQEIAPNIISKVNINE